jgi:SAM-dependent methyltransferase
MLRKEKDNYKGLSIAAAPGTHEAIANMVIKYCQPNNSILELGAYTGAMIERLHNLGYTQISAADLDNHLVISNISHVQCDFNTEFSSLFSGKRFDCIIASEVIEHLNDVRNFLKQCFELLNPEGIIIVTTPNIGFFEGRVKFFLQGELWGFGAKNYLIQRHISPISIEQFPLVLQETGFSTLEIFTAASFATTLRKIITGILWIPMRLFFGPFVLGETVICVGKKSNESSGKFQSADLWKKSS